MISEYDLNYDLIGVDDKRVILLLVIYNIAEIRLRQFLSFNSFSIPRLYVLSELERWLQTIVELEFSKYSVAFLILEDYDISILIRKSELMLLEAFEELKLRVK